MDKSWFLLLVALASWITLKIIGLGTWTWEASNQYGILLNLGWLTVISAMEAYHAHRTAKRAFSTRWKVIGAQGVALCSCLSDHDLRNVVLWRRARMRLSNERNQQLELLEFHDVNDPVAIRPIS